MISCKYRWNSYKFSIGRHCVALVTLFQWIFVTSTRCSKYYLFQTLLNNGKTQICHTIETSQQNCIVQVRMYNSRTILFCNECYVEFGSVHCLTQCVGWMLMSWNIYTNKNTRATQCLPVIHRPYSTLFGVREKKVMKIMSFDYYLFIDILFLVFLMFETFFFYFFYYQLLYFYYFKFYFKFQLHLVATDFLKTVAQ